MPKQSRAHFTCVFVAALARSTSAIAATKVTKRNAKNGDGGGGGFKRETSGGRRQSARRRRITVVVVDDRAFAIWHKKWRI